MSFFESICGQYLLETLAFAGLGFAALAPRTERFEPRKVLLVLVALNVLRFGGAAGALASISHSSAPAFLMLVALGDAATAALALVAFVLLRRRSGRALSIVRAMNVVGLADILTSEAVLQWLDSTGRITRAGMIHGPTIGAAAFTAIHLLVFAFIAAHRKDAR